MQDWAIEFSLISRGDCFASLEFAVHEIAVWKLRFGTGALLCGTLLCAGLLPGMAAAQITVLRHVTLIDGNGGAPRRNAALIVNGEKIQAIADGGRSPAERGDLDRSHR